MTNNDRTALVLGATGGVGGEVAHVLAQRGWRVRGLSRRPQASSRDAIQWIVGDAMDRRTVIDAADGAQLIVHAVNPPGYKDWDKLVLPMIDNTIAAAKASGARILVPGNVYNFGPDALPLASETSPQNPRTRKGAIRVQMEQRLAQAAEQDGVRALVVRAGDFFGGRSNASSWFAQGLVKPGRPVNSITSPVRPGAGHAWAYLPDLAKAMAMLVERDANEGFETYHFAGHFDPDGTRMIAAIRAAVGRPDLPVRAFPWPVVTLVSPFVTMLREMMEMRYLWRETLQLDNAKLVRTLGAEPHTPWDDAVRAALVGLGCLTQDVDAGAKAA